MASVPIKRTEPRFLPNPISYHSAVRSDPCPRALDVCCQPEVDWGPLSTDWRLIGSWLEAGGRLMEADWRLTEADWRLTGS